MKKTFYQAQFQPRFFLSIFILFISTSVFALTEWENGINPEGSNAYTLKRHIFRLNVFGRSSYGITDKLEVSTIIPLFFFPNFSFKYRFYEKEKFAAAYQISAGAGIYPLVGGGILPGPGIIVAAGAAGFFGGSLQCFELHATYHPTKIFSASAHAGPLAVEGAFLGLGAGLGLGGGGVGGAIIPIGVGSAVLGYNSGFETLFCIDEHNSFDLRANMSGLLPIGKAAIIILHAEDQAALVYAHTGWTHSRRHFRITLGAYTFLDPPRWKMVTESKMPPIGPAINVYWLFNNHRNDTPDIKN